MVRPERFELPTFWFVAARFKVRRCSLRCFLFNLRTLGCSVNAVLYADIRGGSGQRSGQSAFRRVADGARAACTKHAAQRLSSWRRVQNIQLHPKQQLSIFVNSPG